MSGLYRRQGGIERSVKGGLLEKRYRGQERMGYVPAWGDLQFKDCTERKLPPKRVRVVLRDIEGRDILCRHQNRVLQDGDAESERNTPNSE